MKKKPYRFCALLLFSLSLSVQAENGQRKEDTKPSSSSSSHCVIRGDANADGRVTIQDAAFIVEVLFSKRQAPCFKAFDVNEDGRVDTNDPLYLLYLLCVKKVHC